MIEYWAEFTRFMTTNKRLADQFKTISKNGWFSDLEILDIHQQIYRQKQKRTPNILTETFNTEKPETFNQTLHDNDRYTANTQAKTLSQKQQMNH